MQSSSDQGVAAFPAVSCSSSLASQSDNQAHLSSGIHSPNSSHDGSSDGESEMSSGGSDAADSDCSSNSSSCSSESSGGWTRSSQYQTPQLLRAWPPWNPRYSAMWKNCSSDIRNKKRKLEGEERNRRSHPFARNDSGRGAPLKSGSEASSEDDSSADSLASSSAPPILPWPAQQEPQGFVQEQQKGQGSAQANLSSSG